MALSDYCRRREALRAGSLQEAVRSSGLMGGLCKRTHSRLLGERKPSAMRRAGPPNCFSLSLPIAFSFIVGRDIFISPALQLHTLRVCSLTLA